MQKLCCLLSPSLFTQTSFLFHITHFRMAKKVIDQSIAQSFNQASPAQSAIPRPTRFANCQRQRFLQPLFDRCVIESMCVCVCVCMLSSWIWRHPIYPPTRTEFPPSLNPLEPLELFCMGAKFPIQKTQLITQKYLKNI